MRFLKHIQVLINYIYLILPNLIARERFSERRFVSLFKSLIFLSLGVNHDCNKTVIKFLQVPYFTRKNAGINIEN